MDSENETGLKYEDYLDGTRKILEESQKEKIPYKVKVCGNEFIVLPNVFSPKYFFDTELFAIHLPVNPGEDILEIGPGTGAISIIAALKGAKRVVAIDINPDAVKNTNENILLHKVNRTVEVRMGDVYNALESGEKFDTIFWNTPFGLLEEQTISDIEKSVYDPGYKSTKRFIMEAVEHLKEGGKVLIGFSTTLGQFDLLQAFTKKAGMKLQLIYEEESTEVHSVKFEIFEAKF